MTGQRTARHTTEGRCNLCHQVLSKRAMTRHLVACRQKHRPWGGPRGKVTETDIFHIVVQDACSPEYWMHLDAPANATLADLDDLFREVWVECCGHLSQFIIDDDCYLSSPFGELPETEQGMDCRLGEVLEPELEFGYEYDFGTTTALTLRVVSVRRGPFRGKRVQMVARNLAPELLCNECGKPARQVCTECLWDGEGWLCDGCAADHECGEEMLLPVVNSPRVGMCGYTG